jgi:hypothetical protein
MLETILWWCSLNAMLFIASGMEQRSSETFRGRFLVYLLDFSFFSFMWVIFFLAVRYKKYSFVKTLLKVRLSVLTIGV